MSPHNKPLNKGAIFREGKFSPEIPSRITIRNKVHTLLKVKQNDFLLEQIKNNKFDDIINEMSDVFRRIFGDKPWNEYAKCNECKKNISVRKVIDEFDPGISLKKQEAAVKLPNCTDCGTKTTLFWPQQDIFEEIKNDFKEEIYGILLFDEEADSLSGFSYSISISLEKVWKEKLKTLFGNAISYENFITTLKQKIARAPPVDETTSMIFFSEWGVLLNKRSPEASFRLLNDMISYIQKNSKLKNKNIIGYTLKHSPADNIFTNLGFIDIFLADNLVIKTAPINVISRNIQTHTPITFSLLAKIPKK